MKEFELEHGEHVVRELRKHWFLFVLELFPYVLFMLFPFLLPHILLLAPPLAPYAAFFDYTSPLMRAALGAWLLIMWTGAWGAFTRYFLNAWILTNLRIVEIHQRGWFNREVSSVLLNRVQDVTTTVIGIIPSLLSIGTIKVQSAGADVDLMMRGIPRPEQMRDLILKYVPDGPMPHHT